MKILLVSDYFYPVSNGGTEKYVYLLAQGLEAKHSVVILSAHNELATQIFNGLTINYLQPNTDLSNNVIKGIKQPNNIEQFKSYLQQEKPDVVHFHTLTPNLNHHHIRASHQLGFKTYFTSHVPGHQCPRGDFMHYGSRPCDGKLEKNKCHKCITNDKGVIEQIAKRLYYKLTANNPVELKLNQLQTIQQSTKQIIAVCNWQSDFFIKNGISESHISICRQEVDSVNIEKIKNDKIRLGFIGRIDPVKGLHLLLNAFKKVSSNKLTLNIAAITPPTTDQAYLAELKEEGIANINWSFDLNQNQIIDFFKTVDYLVIPSLGLETGPFVAYEALATNTPIIATNFGGQKELIIEGVNGYLFEPNEDALVNLLRQIQSISILKITDTTNHKEKNIANRMLSLYQT